MTNTKPAIIPASDDVWVIIPAYSSSNGPSMMGLPLAFWRVEGNADEDNVRLLPLTDCPEEFNPATDRYCLQYGDDGPYKFPDGEVCNTAKEVLASFERRRRGPEVQ